MKALLWKDYRQNRRILVGVAIMLLIPYVFVTVGELGTRLWHVYPSKNLTELIGEASILSLFLTVLAIGFLGGNAIAGERVDRSAEFVAYLPIARRPAIASKAIVALSACLAFWLVNASVGCVTSWMVSDRFLEVVFDIASTTALGSVLIFGASWLFSSFMSSPPIATMMGLATVVVYAVTMGLIDQARGLGTAGMEPSYFVLCAVLCVVLGIACFVAGVLHYVRRIEP